MQNRVKKIIPCLLLLLVLAGSGLLGTGRVYAQNTSLEGTCKDGGDNLIDSHISQAECERRARSIDPQFDVWWVQDGEGHQAILIRKGTADVGQVTPPEAANARSEFERLVDSASCSIFDAGAGCIAKLAYYSIFQVSAFALWVTGHIFNYMLSIAFDSRMFTDSEFIPVAWGIVRDLSNIFFILILLYVAIELILGLAHQAQKMVGSVIIMALLINFSMFFTGVIIDASNILAVTFYNKITVTHRDASGNMREYPEAITSNEKDASGGIVGYFNPTKLLTVDFLKSAAQTTVGGVKVTNETGVSSGIILGIVIVSSLIMFFAAYTFFIAGFAFVGRLIELWLLIVASPFAFMSWTFPALASIPDWGWRAWFHRLITAAFMAPAFMFFLYLIFLLIQSALFKGVAAPDASSSAGLINKAFAALPLSGADSFIGGIVLFIIPALIVLTLLLKSVKLAKASAGQLGDSVVTLAGLAGGLILGGAIGGAAKLAQGTAGHWGKMAFESRGLAELETSKKKGLEGWAVRGFGRTLRTIGGAASKSSFDLRKGVAGAGFGLISKATGVNMGQDKFFTTEAGGYEADLKRRDQKRKERAAGLAAKEGWDEKQKLNKLQIAEQDLLLREVDADGKGTMMEAAFLIEKLGKDLKGAEAQSKIDEKVSNADPKNEAKLLAYQRSADAAKDIKNKIRAIKSAEIFVSQDGETIIDYSANTVDGKATKKAESNIKNAAEDAKQANTVAVDRLEKIKAERAEVEKEAATRVDAAKEEVSKAREAAQARIDGARAQARAAETEATEARAEKQAVFENKELTGDQVKAALRVADEKEKRAQEEMKKAREEEAQAVKDLANVPTNEEAIKKAEENLKKVGEASALAVKEAEKLVEKTGKRAGKMKEAVDLITEHAKKGTSGRSINNLQDDDIPEALHAYNAKSKEMARGYATYLAEKWAFPWNQAAREKSAHEIRMGAKPESKGGHGDHHGINIIDDIIGSGIVSAVSGHGHKDSDHGEKK